MRSCLATLLLSATLSTVGCQKNGAPQNPDGGPKVSFPIGTALYWQLSGTPPITRPEKVYDLDVFDAAPAGSYLLEPNGSRIDLSAGTNAGIIDRLHGLGKTVICYVDTGAWENYRPDKDVFPPEVLGNVDANWPNERWLDIRVVSWPKFEGILLARLDLAARLGCDAIEGDQNNSMSNNPGFPITLDDETAWYQELARQIHARGMAAIMKNGIELLTASTASTTISLYEAALNEECNQFNECPPYSQFVAASKVVWNVEYVGPLSAFCPGDNSANYDGYLASKALDGSLWQHCR